MVAMNIARLSVIASALLVALASPFQLPMVLVLLTIAVVGLPHGLFDPWVALPQLKHQPYQLSKFVLFYLSVALLTLSLWFFAPMFSLVVFLAVSCYHFGSDWSQGKQLSDFNSAMLSGGVVLILPVIFHTQICFDLFSLLVGRAVFADTIWLWCWLSVATIYLLFHRRFDIIADLIGLGLLAFFFSPMWYFMIYFCGMHSVRHYLTHWHQHKLQIMQSKGVFVALMVGTYGFCFLIYSLIQSTDSLTPQLITVMFYALASLTIPHMIVMMLNETKSEE